MDSKKIKGLYLKILLVIEIITVFFALFFSIYRHEFMGNETIYLNIHIIPINFFILQFYAIPLSVFILGIALLIKRD